MRKVTLICILLLKKPHHLRPTIFKFDRLFQLHNNFSFFESIWIFNYVVDLSPNEVFRKFNKHFFDSLIMGIDDDIEIWCCNSVEYENWEVNISRILFQIGRDANLSNYPMIRLKIKIFKQSLSKSLADKWMSHVSQVNCNICWTEAEVSVNIW